MSTWTKAWRWICVLGLAVTGVFLALFLRDKHKTAFLGMWQEIESIKAEEQAATVEAVRGQQEAIRTIEAQYAEELEELKTESAERVEKLRKDPQKLARALARKGKKLPK